MAQRNGESKVGLILTLIFFILTSLILGVLFYFSNGDIEQAVADQTKAETELKNVRVQLDEFRARLMMNRVAMGTADKNDRQELQALGSTQGTVREAAENEYVRITDNLQPEIEDPKAEMAWTLNLNDGTVENPGVTMSEMVKVAREARDNASDAQAKARQEEAAARADQQAARAELTKAQQAHKQMVDRLQAENETIRNAKAAEFLAVRQEADDKGKERDAIATGLSRQKRDLDNKVKALENELAVKEDLLAKYRSNQEPPRIDLNKPHGRVVSRRDDVVQIDIGASSRLRQQVTFSIFAPNSQALGQGASIDYAGRVNPGINPDLAPTIPPGMKGAIEVQSVQGNTATCRIVFESNEIQDPIRAGDLLFNPAWEPNRRERVAFAGIIDLDGDGLDDNDQFVRLLERHGVIVDAYLDLKEREIKGRGINLETDYLVVAPSPDLERDFGLPGAANLNDPRREFKQAISEQMGQMRQQAVDNGVQVMSSRRFLAYMGIDLPTNAAAPDYSASEYYRARNAGAGAAAPMGLPPIGQ